MMNYLVEEKKLEYWFYTAKVVFFFYKAYEIDVIQKNLNK